MEDLRKKLLKVISDSKLPLEAISFVVGSVAREISYEYKMADLNEQIDALKKSTNETPQE